MSDKVLLIIGDASETLDTLYPYYRLQEEGFEPVIAGGALNGQPLRRGLDPGASVVAQKSYFYSGELC